LTSIEFNKLVLALAAHVKEIKHVDGYVIQSVHRYYDTDNDGKLSFDEFYIWWKYSDKFKLMHGDAGRHISKANHLYTSHAKSENNQLTYDEFEGLLHSLKVEHGEDYFDEIDKDGNGLMSFREFFDWLKWV
jgi:Ca2+-binding EF-hand superfamily protein